MNPVKPIRSPFVIRRKYIAAYFLLMCIPCGAAGLYGDLAAFVLLGDAISQPIPDPEFTWSNRLYQILTLIVLALFNTGFLLLVGYGRIALFTRPLSDKIANMFWGASAFYNLALAMIEIYFLGNSHDLLVGAIVIPVIGTLLSIACVNIYEF